MADHSARADNLISREDFTGCPSCGAAAVRRIAPPDSRSLDVERLDVQASGFYVCERCPEEFYVELSMVERKAVGAMLPFFEPTAKCVACGSYRTRITYTQPRHRTRSHECKDCGQKFKTRH